MDISSGGVDSRTGIQTEKQRPDDVEGSQRVQEVTRDQQGHWNESVAGRPVSGVGVWGGTAAERQFHSAGF